MEQHDKVAKCFVSGVGGVRVCRWCRRCCAGGGRWVTADQGNTRAELKKPAVTTGGAGEHFWCLGNMLDHISLIFPNHKLFITNKLTSFVNSYQACLKNGQKLLMCEPSWVLRKKTARLLLKMFTFFQLRAGNEKAHFSTQHQGTLPLT